MRSAAAGDRNREGDEASGPKTILLVEDEISVRVLCRRLLESYGYTVLEACSGEEAEQTAKSHEGPIHLLLTDVVLPTMSGSDLVSRIASGRPEMRVLYMSGYADEDLADHGVVLDGAILPKPFTPDTLARKVREML